MNYQATFIDGIELDLDTSSNTITLKVNGKEVDSWDSSSGTIDEEFPGNSGANYHLNGFTIREQGYENGQPMVPTNLTGTYAYTAPSNLVAPAANYAPIIMLSIAIAVILLIFVLLLYKGNFPLLVAGQNMLGIKSSSPKIETKTGTETEPKKKRHFLLLFLIIAGAIVFYLASLRQKYPNTIRIGDQSDLGAGYGWRCAIANSYLPISLTGIMGMGTNEAEAVTTWCEKGNCPQPEDLDFIHNAVVEANWTPAQAFDCLKCDAETSDPLGVSQGYFDTYCNCEYKSPTENKFETIMQDINTYAVPPAMLALALFTI
jgi:hypothetical protein